MECPFYFAGWDHLYGFRYFGWVYVEGIIFNYQLSFQVIRPRSYGQNRFLKIALIKVFQQHSWQSNTAYMSNYTLLLIL